MNPKKPGLMFMQKHWDVMRSDDAGDSWQAIVHGLPAVLSVEVQTLK